MTAAAEGSRSVARIVRSITTEEGAGFVVHRPFPTEHLSHFDPFLLLDQMGPVSYGPGQAKGAPDHPHRGFETVTYVLKGVVEHKDSAGNSGAIGPGDVQWMTAGAGVVHSEMPGEELQRTGGTLHGFQLWVNLPRRDKMMRPRYQGVSTDRVPTAESEDGKVWVRVIAGEAMDAKAVIETRTPIIYLHFTLQPGARVEQAVPRDYNAFAYVVDGAVLAGMDAQPVAEAEAALFNADGAHVALAVPDSAEAPVNVLLIAGVPLNEPIARYGPFVMNTREEIYQAITDFNSGRMGRITV